MTDTPTTIFAHYINVAEVLGTMFAPILEVVVHDLRTPEHSIIAIYNGTLADARSAAPPPTWADACSRAAFPIG